MTEYFTSAEDREVKALAKEIGITLDRKHGNLPMTFFSAFMQIVRRAFARLDLYGERLERVETVAAHKWGEGVDLTSLADRLDRMENKVTTLEAELTKMDHP